MCILSESGVNNQIMPEIKNITNITTGLIKNETYPSFNVSRRNKISVKIPVARNNSVLSFNIMYFIFFVSLRGKVLLTEAILPLIRY